MLSRKYCDSWLVIVSIAYGLGDCRSVGQTPGSASKTKAAPPPGSVLYLRRWIEQKEQAFSVLVPAGWLVEGGVVRVNPQFGPTNSVAAKIDFSLKKDQAGSVMMHWFGNYTYKDPRYLMGNFPVGSNYMGSLVYPLPDPQSFMEQFAFRRQRPQAQNIRVLERKPLPELAQRYRQRAVMPNQQFEAGATMVAYDEGGIAYKEKLMAVIEFVNGQGMGMWTNHDTLAVRALAAEFERLTPLFGVIEGSIKGNPQWVAGENRGGAERARKALETQRYLQDQRRAMLEHQREANAEVRHSNWLFITGQEDYINPYTGEVEQGSNQYKYRWVNSGGDVIYSNDGSYDPGWDSSLPGRSDYKRTPARQR